MNNNFNCKLSILSVLINGSDGNLNNDYYALNEWDTSFEKKCKKIHKTYNNEFDGYKHKSLKELLLGFNKS